MVGKGSSQVEKLDFWDFSGMFWVCFSSPFRSKWAAATAELQTKARAELSRALD